MRTNPTRRAALALAASLGLLSPAGCEHELPPNTAQRVVDVKTLPEPVRAAFAKALPGVTLQDARENIDTATKGLHSYEVRGRDNRGKIREARITPAGQVLETE